MSTQAFQRNAFQNNAFQVGETTDGLGGYYKRKPKIRYEPPAPIQRNPIDVIFEQDYENDNKPVRLVTPEHQEHPATVITTNVERLHQERLKRIKLQKLKVLALLLLLSEA